MLKLKLTVVVIFVYMSSKLEYINSKGRQKTTAFARVKDVNAVIQEIIRGRGIKRPLVALGLDSGQGKLVVTMAVYDRDELEGLQEHQEVEPHLQQEDVQHEKVLFLLQGALIILSKKNEAQEVTHPGAGGADNLQQEDMYCFAFDEILFTLNTRIIATFNGYSRSYLS